MGPGPCPPLDIIPPAPGPLLSWVHLPPNSLMHFILPVGKLRQARLGQRLTQGHSTSQALLILPAENHPPGTGIPHQKADPPWENEAANGSTCPAYQLPCTAECRLKGDTLHPGTFNFTSPRHLRRRGVGGIRESRREPWMEAECGWEPTASGRAGRSRPSIARALFRGVAMHPGCPEQSLLSHTCSR